MNLHEEPSLLTGASLKDVDSLEGHILETGLVKSRLLVSSGRERLVQVLLVHVAVEPLGHVAVGEDTKSLLRVRGRHERSAVLDDLVALFRELIVVVLFFFH